MIRVASTWTYCVSEYIATEKNMDCGVGFHNNLHYDIFDANKQYLCCCTLCSMDIMSPSKTQEVTDINIDADPPSFVTRDLSQHYVLLGNPLSLVCGRGLDSNPQATITWTASDDTTIRMNGGRYTLENGPEIVRLNFSTTRMSDEGVWRCNVMVTSDRFVVIGAQLELQTGASIGSITQDIQLTVIGELRSYIRV